MNHVAVALEHVDLLNGLDGLDIELLEGLLKLLVVAGGASGGALDLSPGSSLATVFGLSGVRIRCVFLLGGGGRTTARSD